MSREPVAYLVKRFPRLSETFVLQEFLELRRQGLDLRLYALMHPGEQVVQPAAAELLPEVTYLHDRGRPWRSWARLLGGAARQALSNPSGLAALGRLLLVRHPSLASLRHAVEALWLARDLRLARARHLHAHFAHSPAAVAHMARVAGGPAFSFTAHAKDLYTTPAEALRPRLRAAAFVVTCTRFNADHIAGLDPEDRTLRERLHVLYHGTEITRFNPTGRRPEPGRVLSVGRLVPKKGYPALLHALGLLAAKGMDFTCDVFGEGELRPALEAEIERLGLRSRVRLRGAVPQEELVPEYRRASVLALTPMVMPGGDRDGIPNVLVEAMACAVPVISTRVSGIPELIEHGTDGLLVEPADPTAITDGIDRLLRDPELASRMGHAGRRKVERLFDVRRNTTRLRDLVGETGAPARAPGLGE
jgi:glycosyltransferase involved in cell wall biosynthesis